VKAAVKSKKMALVDGELLEEVFESAYDEHNADTALPKVKEKAARKPLVPPQMLLSPDMAAFTGKVSMARAE